MSAGRARGPGWRATLVLGACLGLAGCRKADPPRADTGQLPPSASVLPPPRSAGEAPARPRVLLDLFQTLEHCELHHRGELIDFGTEATRGRLGWVDPSVVKLDGHEKDAATWARVFEKKLDISFYLEAPSPIFVSTRVQGQAAQRIAVYLDDHPLGTLSTPRGQIRVLTTSPTPQAVEVGAHRVGLRFLGSPSTLAEEPRAELDWLRIGVPDELQQTYGPPTLLESRDAAASLSGVPHRALAVRAPGSIRCPLRVPKDAALQVSLGLRGPGEAEGSLRVLRDGAPAEELRAFQLQGGDKASWTDLELPLAPWSGQLVSLELAVHQSARGSRVLFGDPALVTRSPLSPRVPPAKAVVLVVLDGVTRQELSPWGREESVTPELASLARTSVVFDRHRAPSTLTLPSMVTLLTGLLPREHGVTDWGARLPASTPTLGRIARESSVRTALFTAVPWSFGSFGFSSAWERFSEYLPSSGEPATLPFEEAGAWLGQAVKDTPGSRLLTLVHARGGHPPWDVPPKVLSTLPPADYPGLIEPRRAAQVLATLSKKRGNVDLGPPDRERLLALATVALTGQDRGLSALVAALRAAGLWNDTLLIVTGAVATGAGGAIPYGEGRDLAEESLTLPLLVHFPGDALGGKRVAEPTDLRDLTRTAALALGLGLPPEVRGHDLAQIAAGLPEADLEPQLATLGDRYALRVGSLVLSGRTGAAPSLCDLGLDPTCSFDRRPTQGLATLALYRRYVGLDLLHRAPDSKREPVVLDPDTAAALKVWGAITE